MPMMNAAKITIRLTSIQVTVINRLPSEWKGMLTL
jgi:hypothetical protein